MRPWEDRSEVRPGATRPCSSGRNWWSSTELCPQSVSNQNHRHSRATQCSSEGTLVAMMPRNHAATPQVLDPREKRQTIKSALYQQKEFLTVPLGASQTAPSVAKTVTHNTPGCCRNNFCSSQIVEISTLNAMIQKCWNWPFPESLGASCATAGRAIAQLPPGQRNLDRKSNVIWSWLCYPKPSCATAGRAIAQLASSVVLEARWGKLRYSTAGGSTTRLRVAQPGSNNVAFSVQVALSRGQLRYGTASGSTTSPQISVSEVGKIGKLKATKEASSAKPRGTVSNCLGYRGCCFRSTQEYCEQLTVLATGESASFPNYFTSCDPHHDIYPFCYWQIFWHSIWHIFWHSIWHTFWHSIWQTFWHFIWHIFWHIFWHSIWHSIWHTFWHSIWQTFWHFIWHICWHSIWHFTWHSIWHTFGHSIWHIIWQIFWYSIWQTFWHSIWPYLMAFYLAYLLAFDLTFYLASLLAFYLAVGRFQVEAQRCTLSWGTSTWDCPRWVSIAQVPGWGPAVLTELGGSQVEVQRCSLSWAGPRLRSSDAHSPGTVPGWGPAVHTELGRWRRARQGGGRGAGVGGGGEGGGGAEEEEEI